ncbi:MAG: hypothetical protein ACLFVO_14645 [Chloroflexaceae bacterium]
MDHEHREMNEKHETTNADMYPAIPGLAGDIASGRAEEAIFIHKNFALCAKFL